MINISKEAYQVPWEEGGIQVLLAIEVVYSVWKFSSEILVKFWLIDFLLSRKEFRLGKWNFPKIFFSEIEKSQSTRILSWVKF